MCVLLSQAGLAALDPLLRGGQVYAEPAVARIDAATWKTPTIFSVFGRDDALVEGVHGGVL